MKIFIQQRNWAKEAVFLQELFKADIVIGLFRSKEREQFLDFSHPVMEIKTNVYVRQKMDIGSLLELQGIPVGVIEKDFAVTFLASHQPHIKMKLYPGSNAPISDALAGNLDAYALDFANAISLLAENEVSKRTI